MVGRSLRGMVHTSGAGKSGAQGAKKEPAAGRLLLDTAQNLNTTPTTALARMNQMGCRFLVNLTQWVSTSSTAAKAMAFQLKNARPAAPVFTMAMSTTEMPAAATSAVEAGRRP